MLFNPFKLYRRLFGLAVLLLGGGTAVMVGVIVIATGSLGTDRLFDALGDSEQGGTGREQPEVPLAEVVERRPLLEAVPLPSELSRDEDVVATNVGLAILLAILFGIITTTLGNIIREEEATFRRWLTVPFLRDVFRAAGWSTGRSVRSGCLTLPMILVVFTLYGVIFAFLERGLDLFSADGLQLVLVMALSVGLISLAGDFAQRQVALLWRRGARFGLYPANLFIAAATTVFSRLFGLSPGIVFGVPGGVDIDTDDEPLLHEVILAFTTLVTMAVLGAIGWATAALVHSLGDQTLSPAQADLAAPLLELAFAVGLALFLVAIETSFFEMVPLTATLGSDIFRWNPLVWFGAFLPVLFLFVHSLLNPHGAYLEAFEQTNLQVLTAMIVVLGLITAGLWFYFRVLHREPAPARAAPYVPPPATFAPPVPPPYAAPGSPPGPPPAAPRPTPPPAGQGYVPPPIIISDDVPPPIVIRDEPPPAPRPDQPPRPRPGDEGQSPP